MNTVVTSREALLEASKRIAAAKGIQAISMRAVAAEAEVAVGSVYNYFPSKAVLISETIGDIWCEVFHKEEPLSIASFYECVVWLIQMLTKCSKKYPDFLKNHASGISKGEAKEQGRLKMEEYWKHIHEKLQSALEKDRKIKPGIFTEKFTQKDLTEFMFANVLTYLSNGDEKCEVLLEVVDRILYR